MTFELYFVVAKPKIREIHAADFSDRVVYHWLVPRLADLRYVDFAPAAPLSYQVSELEIKEAAYLKGGLKRRLITRIYVNLGVPLCYTVF